jgi:serine protease Do
MRLVKHCGSAFAILAVGLGFAASTPRALAGESATKSGHGTGRTFAAVAKRVSPAVVFIKIEKRAAQQPISEFSSPLGDDLFGRLFGTPGPGQFQQAPPRRQRHVVGQGSGFIISADGIILTNNHVVGDADRVTVILEDGREFAAKTLGTDPHSDVAVIKIDAKNLPVLPLGDSDALEVGEWVLAVGNPFGLSHTLTAGIVSAKGRSSVGIADYENFIQTDAAINPGNSGGPLVDLNGRAVGMNTAIFSRSGGYMGIGFAIPINMAKSIKDQLVKGGSVTRGYLGIVIQDLTPDLAKTFGLQEAKGILVAEVATGSPAAAAKLERGDVIVEFDGNPVAGIGAFRNRVALMAPGTKVPITVLRDGKRKTVTIAIGTLPDDLLAHKGASQLLDELGMTVQDITPELAGRLGVEPGAGVVITQVAPGSVAASAGLQPGAVIREVNHALVHSSGDLHEALRKTPEHGTVLVLVRDGQFSRYVTLKTE